MNNIANYSSHQTQILVLDFGSQYTQLIARRLRECGIYTEIIPYFASIDSIKAKNPKGIILSGGPASVYDKDSYKPDSNIFDLGVPILGICYGMQYIADFFGGRVAKTRKQEFGRANLKILTYKKHIDNNHINPNIISSKIDSKYGEFLLSGTNVYLRKLSSADWRDIKMMLQDSTLMSAWGKAFSEDEARTWLNNQIQSYQDYGFGLWAVIEKQSGEMIGQCGITLQKLDFDDSASTPEAGEDEVNSLLEILDEIAIDNYSNLYTKQQIYEILENKRGFKPELSYIFKKEYWRKGYATESARLCMEYAFEVLGMPLVISLIATNNPAPQNVAKRLEMRIVGKIKNARTNVVMPHFVYIITANDWENLTFKTVNESKKKSLEFTNFYPAVTNYDNKSKQNNHTKTLDDETTKEIIKIWKDSVSATYHFLREEHIQEMEKDIRDIIPSLHIIVANDYQSSLGFIGLLGNKIETIFVKPSAFKRGIGKALIQNALDSRLVDYEEVLIDCHEENSDAIKFYHSLGFNLYSRSAKDSRGRDFPLVHLRARVLNLARNFGLPYNVPMFDTKRLIAREMKQSDIQSLNAMLFDYEVMGAWEYNFNDASVQEWLDTQQERYKKFGFGLWAVIEKQSGEMIGQAGFSLQKYNDKKVLGMTYIIKKNHWHKGYGAEIAEGCKKYAFDVLRTNEIYLLIKEGNESSKSVANKINAIFIDETTWTYRGREMQRLVYRIKNSSINDFSLQTHRTILRPLQESDYLAIKEMLQDNETMKAWNGALDDKGVKEWINNEKSNYDKFGIGWWVVVDKHSGQVIGQVGLSYTNYLELYYMFNRNHWHKGYALEVAQACKDYAFKHLRAKEIYCICREDNIASQNVAKRIGMDKTKEIISLDGNVRYYEFRAISRISPVTYKHLHANEDSKQDYKPKITVNAIQLIDTKSTMDLSAVWYEHFSHTHNHLSSEELDANLANMQNILHHCEQCLSANVAMKYKKSYYETHAFLVGNVFKSNIFQIFLTSNHSHFSIEGKALLDTFIKVSEQDMLYVPCLREEKEARRFYEALGFSQESKDCIFSEHVAKFYENHLLYGIDRKKLIDKLQSSEFNDSELESLNKNLDSSNAKIKPHQNQATNKLFANVKQDSIVWMSHADKVESMPQGFVEIAKSGNTQYCAIANHDKKIYALQFHPEVTHSEYGAHILENFATKICNCKKEWNMRSFADSEIVRLKSLIPNDSKVLCAVSGGVDSSVVAALLYRAIGENLIPVFVDTGLLRKGEKEAVEKMFKENLKVPLITANASALFLSCLKGVIDPEKKRKIIGETFIEVFEKEAKKHNAKGEIKFLAQGTLYPDVIESVSVRGPSKTIKSHHNVGGLPEWMKFELIEPLRELFKNEVRALGRELGMPESMLMRHPFPGPGLAIRIMGEVNKADLDLLREADSIFIEELHKAGLYDKVWQAFCVLLNVRSVGVMGDNRTYDNTICIRAVEAIDGMTASLAHLPHDFLEGVSNRIINEVKGINRVVYDITSKPPGTIEWE